MNTRLRALLSRITFPGLLIEAGREDLRWHLRVYAPEGSPYAEDSQDAGKSLPWYGRKWRLSEHMTDGEIAQTALMAVLAALEHEARERFLVDGVPVFDPHYDLDKLVALRSSPGGGLLVREGASS